MAESYARNSSSRRHSSSQISAMYAKVGDEATQERILPHCLRITYQSTLPSGSCDGYIHSPVVCQEPYFTLGI